MRLRPQSLLSLFCSLLLAGGGLGFALAQADSAPGDVRAQDEQDDEEDVVREPYAAFLQSEHKRLTKEVEGAWMLSAMQASDEFVDEGDFRGFAMFGDGYATILFMGAEDSKEIFSAPTFYTVSSGAYRYRVSEDLTFQLASVMGIDNLEGAFSFHSGGDSNEYQMQLDGDDLTLWKIGGNRYEYRRLGETGFPEAAAERLRLRRSELYEDEDENR